MEKPVAVLANRLYVPAEHVTQRHRKAYTYVFGPDEASDNPDDYVVKRTYREFPNGYIGFARGDLGKLRDIFYDDFEIQDERMLVPHGYDLEFTGELNAEQMLVWRKWLRFQYGMIEAPARWGKTVYMAWSVVKLRQRSLVLAQEWSLLEQFEEEFRAFTNVNQLERRFKQRLIGRPKKSTDVFPIVTLSAWQSYASKKGNAALLENRDAWGAVLIDEAHSAAAPCFSKVVGTLNAWYRLPVTATPERKDEHHVLTFDIAGPVVAVGKKEGLPVEVIEVRTGLNIPHFKQWATMLSHLSKNEKRNQLIVDNVIKDVADGHSVLVVTDRIQHLKTLRTILEEKAPDISVKMLFGDVVGEKRKALRKAARLGEIQVVIAYSKIVQLGWNVRAWSSIHNTMPCANEPNWYQRISRVRTPCANCPGVKHPDCLTERANCMKKPPKAYVYVDEAKVSYSCFKILERVHERLGFTTTVMEAPEKPRKPVVKTRSGRGLSWTALLDS